MMRLVDAPHNEVASPKTVTIVGVCLLMCADGDHARLEEAHLAKEWDE